MLPIRTAAQHKSHGLQNDHEMVTNRDGEGPRTSSSWVQDRILAAAVEAAAAAIHSHTSDIAATSMGCKRQHDGEDDDCK
jgi:hypothetical protein